MSHLCLSHRAWGDDEGILMPVEDVKPFCVGFKAKLVVLQVTALKFVGKLGKQKATVVFGTATSNMIGLPVMIAPTDPPDEVAAKRDILSGFKVGSTYLISGLEMMPCREQYAPLS